ncbi:MAG: ZIP family metal transporter [Candidatus Omnitrophica bacterium]|nr:ZIP family metal transporter [Candidatus Omnitrophota bacterium]
MTNALFLAAVAGLADFLGALLALGSFRFSHRAVLYLFAMSGGYLVTWSVANLIPLLVSHSPALVFWVLAGYFGLYLIEHLFATHAHPDSPGENPHSHALVESWTGHTTWIAPAAGWAAAWGLLIHSFFDGAGIVASFSIHPSVGTLVFFAVLLHKIPEGSSLTSILGASRQSQTVIVISAAAVGLMTFLGGVAVWVIGLMEPGWAYLLLALSAGTFLFIGASNLIPSTQKGESRWTILAVFSGVFVYWLVSFLVGISGIRHHH